MKQIIKYALRNKKTGKLVGFVVSSNEGGDFCGDTQTTLWEDHDPIWYATSLEHAELVRLHSTPWYNATMESPTNDINPETLEVVRIETQESIVPLSVKIPTMLEYCEERYGKDDPNHLEYIKGELKKDHRNEMHYSYNDLKELFRRRKEQQGVNTEMFLQDKK